MHARKQTKISTKFLKLCLFNFFYRLHSSRLTTTLLRRDFVIHLLVFDLDPDITSTNGELFMWLLMHVHMSCCRSTILVLWNVRIDHKVR